jgi:hypothetical protein
LGLDCWNFEDGSDMLPEKSVTPNLRFVTSHKGEDFKTAMYDMESKSNSAFNIIKSYVLYSVSLTILVQFNLLKPSGNFTYHQV